MEWEFKDRVTLLGAPTGSPWLQVKTIAQCSASQPGCRGRSYHVFASCFFPLAQQVTARFIWDEIPRAPRDLCLCSSTGSLRTRLLTAALMKMEACTHPQRRGWHFLLYTCLHRNMNSYTCGFIFHRFLFLILTFVSPIATWTHTLWMPWWVSLTPFFRETSVCATLILLSDLFMPD